MTIYTIQLTSDLDPKNLVATLNRHPQMWDAQVLLNVDCMQETGCTCAKCAEERVARAEHYGEGER